MFLTLDSCILLVTLSFNYHTDSLTASYNCTRLWAFPEKERRILFHWKSMFCLSKITDTPLRKLPQAAGRLPCPELAFPTQHIMIQLSHYSIRFVSLISASIYPCSLPCEFSIFVWWNEDFEVRWMWVHILTLYFLAICLSVILWGLLEIRCTRQSSEHTVGTP